MRLRRVLSMGLLLMLSCKKSDSSQTILDDHRAKLDNLIDAQNVIASAQCVGPRGTYTTEVHSDLKGDYLYFRQAFSYKSEVFAAVLYIDSVGFTLDSLLRAEENLNATIVDMLQSHEFHRIWISPTVGLKNIGLSSDTLYFGIPCRSLTATNQSGLTYRLLFNKDNGLFAGFMQPNNLNPEESIAVLYHDYYQENDAWLFDKVKIQQGKDQIYTFDFAKVVFNDSEFEKLKLETKKSKKPSF